MKKKKIEENEPFVTEGIIAPIQSEREIMHEFYRKLGIPNGTHKMIGKMKISFTTFSTSKEDTEVSTRTRNLSTPKSRSFDPI